MSNDEYYKIALSLILQNNIHKYNLTDKQINLFFLCQGRKGDVWASSVGNNRTPMVLKEHL